MSQPAESTVADVTSVEDERQEEMSDLPECNSHLDDPEQDASSAVMECQSCPEPDAENFTDTCSDTHTDTQSQQHCGSDGEEDADILEKEEEDEEEDNEEEEAQDERENTRNHSPQDEEHVWTNSSLCQEDAEG